MKIKQILIVSLVFSTIGFLFGVIAGLIVGVEISKSSDKNQEKEVITSTVILDKIKDQSFLITRTVITDQDVTITIDQGSAWSNFWWGHEITTEGTVQVDVGVDLSNLVEDDIEVDSKEKIIKINLPDASIYDSSLKGSIEVTTKSGILKKLFETDTNEDYNLAMAELTSKAQEGIEEDEELLEEASSSALSTLQAILKDTGYTVTEK